MNAEIKPKLKIIGKDGNAFAIMGAAFKKAHLLKWEKAKIDQMMNEMTRSDYNNLLNVVVKYFDVY